MTNQELKNLREQLEIIKLKEKLNRLQGNQENKSQNHPPSLGSQFEEIGKTMGEIRDNIPHIKVGDSAGYQEVDPVLNKWKKWFVRGLVILIVITTISLVAWRIAIRFL